MQIFSYNTIVNANVPQAFQWTGCSRNEYLRIARAFARFRHSNPLRRKLRHNSHCHFAAGIPIFPAAIGGIIEETVADEMPFTDEDTLGMLANLIDPGTCENLNGPQTGHFTCSACGADGPLGKVRLPDDSCKNGWRSNS